MPELASQSPASTASQERGIGCDTICRSFSLARLRASGEVMADTSPQGQLTIDITDDSGASVTLVCRGVIVSANAEEFKSKVKALAASHQYVLADMGAVDYVDSSGLGSIAGAFLSAKSAGCNLKIIKAHPRFKDLLNMTRLATVLEGIEE
jgi:anti-anti-sigma factor